MPKIIPSEIEFAFASGGGVATSMLGEFFGENHRINTPSDEDGFKHMPMPPVSLNPNFRYVFVFGDPVAATISLFRRGYHALQSRKLQRGYRPYHPIPLTQSLEEYAQAGEDRFFFERQFENYFDRHLICPTLFLHYDHVWDNLEMLGRFLGIESAEMAKFPPRRTRQSDQLDVTPETRERLEKIYQPYRERLNSLPGAFVRGASARRVLPRLCTKNFQLAVKNGIVSRFRPVTGPYGE